MKKIFSFLILGCLICFVSGCGSHTITCSKTSGNDEESLIATVKGGKITKITISEVRSYDDLDELDDDYQLASSSNYLYKLLKGVDSQLIKDDYSLKNVVTIDLNKAGSTVVREFFDFLEFTPEVFTDYAESQGMVCQ